MADFTVVSNNNEFSSVLDGKKLLAQELWNGNIPIQFCLAASDISATIAPDPYYCVASRFAYLPAVSEDIVSYYRTYAVDVASVVWFEHQGIPLKANLPIGHLYDMFYVIGNERGVSPKSNVSSKNAHYSSMTAPWKVIVHFQYFPVSEIIHCSSGEHAKNYFMHSLKQAIYILQNNLRQFSQLSQSDTDSCWNGVCTGSRLEYEQCKQMLDITRKSMRKIPIRILAMFRKIDADVGCLESQCESGAEKGLNAWNNQYIYSTTQYPAVMDTGSISNTGNINRKASGDSDDCEIATEVTEAVSIIDSNINSCCCSAKDMLDMHIAPMAHTVYSSENKEFTYTLHTHGVEIPLNLSIYELWEMYAYADMFLYLIVIVNPVGAPTVQ